MERMKRVVKVIPAGTWPDSRADQRAYWLSRPPSERVQAGRELQRKMHWWMTGREFPRKMDKVVRVFRYDQ
ncbi:MAG: hypothetical protein Q8T11_10795 [Elusimicrobiota bacterium]|nr:hypothetical protein [Elusimicrobiota bacterium]